MVFVNRKAFNPTEKSKPMNLFPHEQIRAEQSNLLKAVKQTIEAKRNLIVHAPTGLGKTAATITPALEHAIEKNLTVIYLTSRQTQHKIVIDTLRKIKERHQSSIIVTDMIGKKSMCAVPGIQLVNSSEFSEYCKTAREKKTCEFYEKTRKEMNLTFDAKAMLSELILQNPLNAEEVIENCTQKKLCPYYMSLALSSKSNVIIADYNIIFNPFIRDKVINQMQKSLENCIIIIDEAHNLPDRIRGNMSINIATPVIRVAIKEAKENGFSELIPLLSAIQDVLNNLAQNAEQKEELIMREEFSNKIKLIEEYDALVEKLNNAADEIRKEKKRSAIGSIAMFLEVWNHNEEEGYARILSIEDKKIKLSYKCLDPSIVSEPVVKAAYSCIFMSGTMRPTEMYKEVLGIRNCDEDEYKSPFPKKNKLSMIVPLTTTKFTARTDMQFKNIGILCAKMIERIPGNCAVFFPSYDIKDKVSKFLSTLTTKTVFSEVQKMTKQEKTEFLEKFKSYDNAMMLAVASGSFGEGIDLPGVLKGVIIVGLPLKQPDLETKKTMEYYQELFNKGWDYGYIFPAINKALQAAGRCIRSETDKGVIVFLDERYDWPNYRRCFPDHYIVTNNFEEKIRNFWN